MGCGDAWRSGEMAGRWVRPSVVRWLGGLVVSATAVAAVSGLIGLLDPHVPALSLLVLYILVVLSVALVWGTGLAVVTSILCPRVAWVLPREPWPAAPRSRSSSRSGRRRGCRSGLRWPPTTLSPRP
jgi:hypothetical protein